jgi:putative transposase
MPDHANKPGLHALRYGRVSLPGQLYHITTVTLGRAPIFSSHLAARAASRRLNDRVLLKSSRLLSWVLMPDHLHMLVQLGDPDTLPTLINRIKSATARDINIALNREGQLWARSFHDHALRADEDAQQVSRYIVANPLRAGLVKEIGDYPYWNAIWL